MLVDQLLPEALDIVLNVLITGQPNIPQQRRNTTSDVMIFSSGYVIVNCSSLCCKTPFSPAASQHPRV